MSSFHTQVALDGFSFPDNQFTVKLHAGIATTDIGKAVSQDTAGANTVKLAADGDAIVGRLMTVEDRTVEGQLIGTVEFKFQGTLPIKSGLTSTAVVAVGSRVVGAGAGEIKATTTADANFASAPRVWAVNGLVAVAQSL